MEPVDPAGRVLQVLAWPVLTTSANLELPLSPEAETLLGAAIKVRQNASTSASKGRNRMRIKPNKARCSGINRPIWLIGILQGANASIDLTLYTYC